MFDAHKNFPVSTVGVAPSPATSGVTLEVVAGEGTRFPTAPFNAAVWPAYALPTPANAEIVRVTDVTGDVLTMTRAEESTIARTIVAGDLIAANITVKTLEDIESAINTNAADILTLAGLVEYVSNKDAANGYAGLDASGNVPVTHGGTGLAALGENEIIVGTGAAVAAALPFDGSNARYLSNHLGVSWDQIDLVTGVGGVLGPPHGGLGLTDFVKGDLITGHATSQLHIVPIGADGTFLMSNGAGEYPSWEGIVGGDVAGTALSKSDDTNVTATLSGSPSSALLRAVNIALGWTGLLSKARGGTGVDLSATGGAGQVLKQSSSAGAISVGTVDAADISAGAALTKTDDTNVTAALTGTPATGLLKAVNIALGWTGLLGLVRGGTGADLSATGGAGKVLKQSSTGAVVTVATLDAADISAGATLSKVDDTNVTLTLGGTVASALLKAVSLTLGWTGLLAVNRGGTGAGTLTGYVKGTGTTAMTAAATIPAADVVGNDLTKTNDTNVTLTLGGTATGALLKAVSLTLGWTGLLGLARGGNNADLSATGGTGQVLKQNSTGAAVTVGTLAAADVASGAALTKADDTNVTATLGGTPASALLKAVSITLGWTGLLGLARGGTNADLSATGGAGKVLKQVSAGAAVTVATLDAADISAGATLSKVDDTNVTLTLGGTVASALLKAVTLTLGWTGVLAIGRGGTGVSSLTPASYTVNLTDITIGNGSVVGTQLQVGKLVFWEMILTFGTTTTLGAIPRFSVPTAGAAARNIQAGCHGYAIDVSTGASYQLSVVDTSTTDLLLVLFAGASAQSGNAPITTTLPFTWANGDTIRFGGSYFAA